MSTSTQKASKVSKEFIVYSDQLPLHCPTDEMTLWNEHPKVYLAIEKNGKAVCPYCSNCFTLKDRK